MWKLNFTKKRVQATCKWPWGVSLDRWPFRVKFNQRKIWNKIAYSKNTASAKSINTHKKRMMEKIYNAYNFIIHIHTHTYINTYIYTHTHTHTHIYIYIYMCVCVCVNVCVYVFVCMYMYYKIICIIYFFHHPFFVCIYRFSTRCILTICNHTYIYLSDFLRRYFGLIKRVTKSVTICPPPPLPPPNASEPGIGRKSLKISTF